MSGYRITGTWVVGTRDEAADFARMLVMFGAASTGWLPADQPRDITAEHFDPDDARAYRFLADKVIELFNPRDGEEAEESILADHLEMVAKFVQARACICAARPDGEPCGRCAALGQVAGVREQR
jgi:hypothetical protein